MFPRLFDVPEVLEVQVIPSDEVRIVPLSPTATNNGLEVFSDVVADGVAVESVDSSFSPQEMTVRLKMDKRTMFKAFFIFSLH